jgi:hypothetical protein
MFRSSPRDGWSTETVFASTVILGTVILGTVIEGTVLVRWHHRQAIHGSTEAFIG